MGISTGAKCKSSSSSAFATSANSIRSRRWWPRWGATRSGLAPFSPPGRRANLANCGKSSNPTRPSPRTLNLAPDLMSDASVSVLDYSRTLYLPKTDFPMRGGLPQKEPEILAKWAAGDIYRQLRAQAAGQPKFVLHDGPPYANGHIHIGTALNKTLKDLVVRSQQMAGKDSNYVPGWDCHGLPIEWKVEEEYRAEGRSKDEVPIVTLRRECRAFAAHWMAV